MVWLPENWLFHLINYLLAAVGYTLLGRFLLSFFVPENWDNYIWKFFRRITDPVLVVVRRITPASVSDGLLPLVAFFWILFARCLIRHLDALVVTVMHPGVDTFLIYLYFLARCMIDIVLVDIGLIS